MRPQYIENIMKLEIKRNGKDYSFSRKGVNEFGEPTDESTKFTVSGVYHTNTEYVKESNTNGAIVRSKKKPCIMFFKSAEMIMPVNGDDVTINKVKHKVTGTTNIGELENILDVCLEIVDGGSIV